MPIYGTFNLIIEDRNRYNWMDIRAMNNFPHLRIIAVALVALFVWGTATGADTLYDQRFKRWEAKAQQGDAGAQYHLGNAYLRGTEVTRDYKKALQWFEKAATQDDAKSQYKLGYLHFKGDGVPKDYGKAFRWLTRSAHQGYSPAQFYLGRCYEDGLGTDQDYEKALYWFTKAAADNYTPAKGKVAKLKSLVAEQEAKAQPAAEPPTSAPVSTTATPAPRKQRTVQAAPPKTAKKSKTTTFDTRKLLLSGEWITVGDEAASHMPSAIVTCKKAAGKVTCKSNRLRKTTLFARIDYEVLSQFGRFKPDGTFMGSYRSNVLFVLPDDPDNPNPDEQDVPTTGLKVRTLLRCRFVDVNHIDCVNDNFTREKFVRKANAKAALASKAPAR